MGAKGDRATKEPIARRMYSEGHSLAEISRQIDASETTLRRWKDDSRVPGDELDGWEAARAQRHDRLFQIREMVDEQFEYIKALAPADRDSRMLDVLSKMFSIFEKMENREAEIRRRVLEEAADVVEEAAKRGGVSGTTIAAIRRDVLRMAE